MPELYFNKMGILGLKRFMIYDSSNLKDSFKEVAISFNVILSVAFKKSKAINYKGVVFSKYFLSVSIKTLTSTFPML